MQMVSIDELRTVFGVNFSKVHIYRLIRAGEFPQPIKLGEHRSAFLRHEVEAWIAERIAKRDAQKNEAA